MVGFFCEFDFKYKKIKGKQNSVADTLKKKMHVMHVEVINIFQFYMKKSLIESLFF